MKITLALISLFLATTISASTFENFTGEYKVTSKPDIVCVGTNNQNWPGFEKLEMIKVYQQSSLYIIEITSKLNNSPLRSFVITKTYEYRELGTVNKAFTSVGPDSARYTVSNTSTSSLEKYYWQISRSENNFNFEMDSTRVISNAGRTSCRYRVVIKKI